jgi:hypothetical protein
LTKIYNNRLDILNTKRLTLIEIGKIPLIYPTTVMKIWTLFGVAALGIAGTGFGQYATDPVGVVNLNIAPSPNGTTRVLTALSAPLLAEASLATGGSTGKISSLTSNSITCSGAGWTPGNLSVATAPKILRVTSGVAEGRTFLLSLSVANTLDTVTIDGSETTNLTSLGIVTGTNGDTFKLLECDTLSSFFGDPANIVKATSVGLADNVLLLNNGAWVTYFYHSTNNRWSRSGPGLQDASNQRIKPESAILFSRIGTTALALSATGSVPMQKRVDIVRGTGLTFMGSNWPVDITLLSAGIHTLPGWQANATASGADQVLILNNGAWLTYWWNGTNWRRSGPGSQISDTVVIRAGAGILLNKLVPATNGLLSQNRPY